MNSRVFALTVADDGSGPALYAGGQFNSAGGQAANHVARWDGSGWSALGQGLNSWVFTLETFDDGTGAGLYAGGAFTHSPGGDSHLARWKGCPPVGFEAVGGCTGNAASLAASQPQLVLGRSVSFQLQAASPVDGAALLYAGLPGIDANGCGVSVAGLGEWLLLLAPGPLQVGLQSANQGAAAFVLNVPNEPLWAGLQFAFQGVFAALSLPGAPIEFSNALVATFVP